MSLPPERGRWKKRIRERARARSRARKKAGHGRGHGLREIEEENLRVLVRRDRERRLVLDRGAVAGVQRGAVQVDAAARDLEPRAAAAAEGVLDALAAVEDRGVDPRVLMD